ncbi:MAG: hypothetical protein Q4G06_00295 [Clostridia bacterium]|nr:hypothetical protein [Clostridia bacterium]
MATLSLIGIIVAIAVMVYGCIKSVNLVVLTPICALIVALTGGMSIVEGYGTTYMNGMGSFIISQFPVFLTGALFSKFLEVSGLSKSIALSLFKKLGRNNIVLAMIVCNIVLAVAGVNTFVIIFTIFPIALALFKEADLPRKLIPACILGPTVAACMIPGLPTLNNTIPSSAFNVTVLAAPVLGFLGFILMAVGSILYLNHEANKCRARGEHFESIPGDERYLSESLDDGNLPNPLLVLIPLVFVIITLNVFKFPAWGSLFCGSVILVCIFYKSVLGKLNTSLTEAVKNSQVIITTAALSGFGTVVAAVPGYQLIAEGLTKVSFGNPYLYTIIAVAVIAAISGSAYGSMRIASTAIGEKVLALGGNPQTISRLMTMSSLSFDSLPHNSAIVLVLNYCGVSHKDGYKYLGVTTVLMPLLVSILGVILGTLGLC